MLQLTIQSIFTKTNDKISSYLDVFFETDNGLYYVGYGRFYKASVVNLQGFVRCDFLQELKNKYGPLDIVDVRVTYDNNMYFLISNKFLLVLGYTLSSSTEHSINEFWLEENIDGSNAIALVEFYQLDKVNISI